MALQIEYPMTDETYTEAIEHLGARLHGFQNVGNSIPDRLSTKNKTVVFDLDNTLVHAHVSSRMMTMAIRPYIMDFVIELRKDESVEIILWTNGNVSYASRAVMLLERLNGILFDHIIARDGPSGGNCYKSEQIIKRPGAILIDDRRHLFEREITCAKYMFDEQEIEVEEINSLLIAIELSAMMSE